MSVTFADIEAAAVRLSGKAVITPLIESPALNERLGGRVLIKPETLQVGGAFKFRGACNRISQLSDAERKKGVAAYSSGNHAQGLALAARAAGAPAVIVMPADAPAVKITATRAYGAEVVLYDRYKDDRAALTAQIAAERGLTIVPPFDDPHIVAGQGTVGLELMAQAAAPLDYVLTPVGGGGLVSGVATAVKAASPSTKVFGVEPDDFNEAQRSLRTGRIERADPAARSVCDALQAPSPSALTLSLMQALGVEVLTVSDAEAAEAVRYAFSTLKLVVEPGGAVPLAALLAGKLRLEGRTAAIVLSGGNIDPALHAQIMAGEL